MVNVRDVQLDMKRPASKWRKKRVKIQIMTIKADKQNKLKVTLTSQEMSKK